MMRFIRDFVVSFCRFSMIVLLIGAGEAYYSNQLGAGIFCLIAAILSGVYAFGFRRMDWGI